MGEEKKVADDNKLAENKLIILYLLDKMDVALSNNDISQFAMERNIMDYINVQQALSQLTDSGYIEAFNEKSTTRYSITHEGSGVLSLFHNRITEWLKSAANEYILNNKQRIRSEYETSANYFPEINGEYLVKCAVCGLDGNQIMELDVVVPTKSQAQLICNNWKRNINNICSTIYQAIIKE
jgi:predicted transcriptional regulator